MPFKKAKAPVAKEPIHELCGVFSDEPNDWSWCDRVEGHNGLHTIPYQYPSMKEALRNKYANEHAEEIKKSRIETLERIIRSDSEAISRLEREIGGLTVQLDKYRESHIECVTEWADLIG